MFTFLGEYHHMNHSKKVAVPNRRDSSFDPWDAVDQGVKFQVGAAQFSPETWNYNCTKDSNTI